MQIYDILKEDHKKILDLFNRLLLLDDEASARHELIGLIRDELIPHARAEEAVFYNSLRALNAAQDVILDSYQEHVEAETLLRALQVQDKMDFEWKKTALKLKEALEEHIQEEETRIFSISQQLFTAKEAEMIAQAFERLKPDVQKEGFLKTTFDLIVNLMPPRLAPSLRTEGFEPRTPSAST